MNSASPARTIVRRHLAGTGADAGGGLSQSSRPTCAFRATAPETAIPVGSPSIMATIPITGRIRYYVDDNVFDVFSHKIIYGDPKTALKDPRRVAISETCRQKVLWQCQPRRRDLTTDAGHAGKHHTGVRRSAAEHPPEVRPALFGQRCRSCVIRTIRRCAASSCWNVSNYTYLLMAPGFDPKSWPRISDEFFKRYMADTARPCKPAGRAGCSH